MLKIVQISDLHLRAKAHANLGGVDVDTSLQAVLEDLRRRRWPVDFLLATGDLVQDEGAAAYQRMRALLEPLEVPVYCLPGNHDDPAVLAEVLSTGKVRRERRVEAGGWQFLLLDTALAGSAVGHLAKPELVFLEQMLSEQPQLPTMVCLHHHPVPVGSAWMDTMMIDNAPELFAVIDRFPQVKALVFGHIHQVCEIRRNGVALLGVPSTCVQFEPQSSDFSYNREAPGYRWFELHPDGSFDSGVERAPI